MFTSNEFWPIPFLLLKVTSINFYIFLVSNITVHFFYLYWESETKLCNLGFNQKIQYRILLTWLDNASRNGWLLWNSWKTGRRCSLWLHPGDQELQPLHTGHHLYSCSDHHHVKHQDCSGIKIAVNKEIILSRSTIGLRPTRASGSSVLVIQLVESLEPRVYLPW